MKVHFDRDSDALYIRLDDSRIVESEEVKPGVVLDFNEQNQEKKGSDPFIMERDLKAARRARDAIAKSKE